jgi:hypothetical protein
VVPFRGSQSCDYVHLSLIKSALAPGIEQLETVLKDKPGEGANGVSPDAATDGTLLPRSSFLQV